MSQENGEGQAPEDRGGVIYAQPRKLSDLPGDFIGEFIGEEPSISVRELSDYSENFPGKNTHEFMGDFVAQDVGRELSNDTLGAQSGLQQEPEPGLIYSPPLEPVEDLDLMNESTERLESTEGMDSPLSEKNEEVREDRHHSFRSKSSADKCAELSHMDSESENSVSLTSSLSCGKPFDLEPVVSNASPDGLTPASKRPEPSPQGAQLQGPELSLEKYVVGPHPALDFDELSAGLKPLDPKFIQTLEKSENVTQVLVLGGTGNVGRWILRALTDLAISTRPRLIIHCLVRANKLQVAKVRIRDALSRVCADEGELKKVLARLRLWCGDVTADSFGMNEVNYSKLCKRVEGVYVAIGPDMSLVLKRAAGHSAEDFSYYALVSENMVRHWKQVLAFAATSRMKHVWALSQLLTTTKLWVEQTNPQGQVNLVESHVESLATLDKASLSVHTNVFDCIGSCQLVVEALLKRARTDYGYSITIFRLPPMVFHSSIDVFFEKSSSPLKPVSWILLQAMIRVGILPDVSDSFYDLFGHAMDNCVRELVHVSFFKRRVHWIYHILDGKKRATLTKESFLATLRKLGIYLRIAPFKEFLESAVQKSLNGPKTNLYIQDMYDLGRGLQKGVACLRISASHLQHDRSLNEDSEALRSDFYKMKTYNKNFVEGSLRSLVKNHQFLADSLGTLRSVEECRDEASQITGGLKDFGEFYDWCKSGWEQVMANVHRSNVDEERLSFLAQCICARKCVIYLTTLLYMTAREKNNPKILKEEIQKPLVILGLNRAGLTLLHSMFGCDHQVFRCPVLLEMLFPYGEGGDFIPEGLMESNDPHAWERDPRQLPTAEYLALEGDPLGQDLSDECPMSYSGAASEEDSIPFEICGRSYSLATMFGIPEYFDWLTCNGVEEMGKAYAFHRRFFQHLQHQKPGKRLVLKMQWHLLMLEHLLKTYEDCEIIFVHRRPVTAVHSYCNYELELQKVYLQRVNPLNIGERTAESMALAVEKMMKIQEDMALAFVQEHPTLQPPQSFFINLYFEDFTSNPIGLVGSLYDLMEMAPMTPIAEKAMWDFLQDTARHRDLVVCTDRRELGFFGLTREAVKRLFKKYSETYFEEEQKLKRKQEYKIARAIRSNSLDIKQMYDSHGLIVMEGKSWLETTGLISPLTNIEVLLSYARSRFVSSELPR